MKAFSKEKEARAFALEKQKTVPKAQQPEFDDYGLVSGTEYRVIICPFKD